MMQQQHSLRRAAGAAAPLPRIRSPLLAPQQQMSTIDAHNAETTDPKNSQNDQPHSELTDTAGQFVTPPTPFEAELAWLTRKMIARKTPNATRPQRAGTGDSVGPTRREMIHKQEGGGGGAARVISGEWAAGCCTLSGLGRG